MSTHKKDYIVKYKENAIKLSVEEEIFDSLTEMAQFFFRFHSLNNSMTYLNHWYITYDEEERNSNNFNEFEKIVIESDVEDSIVYYFSKINREIIILNKNLGVDWTVQCILRLIRNIFRLLALEKEELFVHGGMVSYNGKGIAIIGEKRSGKTTTILSCLKQGYKFISNDDISFNIDSGKVIGNGWPRGIAVRGDSLKIITQSNKIDIYYSQLNHPGNKLISNSNFNGSEPNGLVFFQPNELVEMFNTELIRHCKLDMIIFPEFSDDKDAQPTMKKLNIEEAFQKLSLNLMDNPGKYNEFLLSSFNLLQQKDVLEKKKEYFMDIPMYSLKIGFNRVLEIPQVINNLF